MTIIEQYISIYPTENITKIITLPILSTDNITYEEPSKSNISDDSRAYRITAKDEYDQDERAYMILFIFSCYSVCSTNLLNKMYLSYFTFSAQLQIMNY